MKKIKMLQLATVIMISLIIVITVIGIYLIGFSDFHYYTENHKWKRTNGFGALARFGLSFVIGHSIDYICDATNNKENYCNWVQLKIGVILCLIISPFLIYMTILFITIILIFKIKSKNNNFWDAIKNCQVINNYYIH